MYLSMAHTPEIFSDIHNMYEAVLVKGIKGLAIEAYHEVIVGGPFIKGLNKYLPNPFFRLLSCRYIYN